MIAEQMHRMQPKNVPASPCTYEIRFVKSKGLIILHKGRQLHSWNNTVHPPRIVHVGSFHPINVGQLQSCFSVLLAQLGFSRLALTFLPSKDGCVKRFIIQIS